MQSNDLCKWLIGVPRAIAWASLLALSLLSTACKQKAQPNLEAAADRMFSKKPECGRLLAHVEDLDFATDKQSTKPPPEPIAFYSPTLNTCVLRTRVVQFMPGNPKIKDVNLVDVDDVEDLLTGEELESHWFHMSVPEEAAEEAAFDNDLMKRYGAQPDQTSTRPHNP